MKRRTVLAAALAAPLAAWSQRARVPKIGYLLYTPVSEPPTRERRAFLEGLRAHGYVPGKNLEIVYGSAQGAAEFLDEVCQDLLAQKVDLIVASGTQAVLAAKRCSAGVPVVIQALGDPVGVGAVASLSRPEANITGVSFLSSDLAGKRVELMRELLPGAKRMGVLSDGRNLNSVLESGSTIDAAGRFGLKAEPFALRSDAELRRFLAALAPLGLDVLYACFEASLVGSHRTALAQAALAARLPLVSGWSFLTEAGGLMSYAPDIPSMFRRSASYVHRILQGAKPGELPIELPRSVELVVNVRTARALGVKVTNAFLVRADRVIE